MRSISCGLGLIGASPRRVPRVAENDRRKVEAGRPDVNPGYGDGMTERLELVIPERRIRARVAALARRIDADYRDKPLSLVVVLKGAAVFAADLMRHITIPFTIDFITAASYSAATRSSGKVALSGLDR